MCGILFIKGKDPATARTLARLTYGHQAHRGKLGFGISDTGQPENIHSLTESQFLADISKTKGDALLLHHRLPTSTVNRIGACHPFRVTFGEFVLDVVHNGVVSNKDEVLAKLQIDKTTLASYEASSNSYNDSEALALDFIDAISTKRKTLYSCGSVAIIGLERAAKKLWLFRNSGNPMKYYEDEDTYILSSENPSGIDVEHDKLFSFEYETGDITEVMAMETSAYQWKLEPSAHNHYRSRHRDNGYFHRGQATTPKQEATESTYGPMKNLVLFKNTIVANERSVNTPDRKKPVVLLTDFWVPCINPVNEVRINCEHKTCVFAHLQKHRYYDREMSAYFSKELIKCLKCADEKLQFKHSHSNYCIFQYKKIWNDKGGKLAAEEAVVKYGEEVMRYGSASYIKSPEQSDVDLVNKVRSTDLSVYSSVTEQSFKTMWGYLMVNELRRINVDDMGQYVEADLPVLEKRLEFVSRVVKAGEAEHSRLELRDKSNLAFIKKRMVELQSVIDQLSYVFNDKGIVDWEDVPKQTVIGTA